MLVPRGQAAPWTGSSGEGTRIVLLFWSAQNSPGERCSRPCLRTLNALADEVEGIWAAAERDGRSLTAGEREYMEGLVEEMKAQHRLEQKIKRDGQEARCSADDRRPAAPNYRQRRRNARATCSSSPTATRRSRTRASRGQTWTSGPVDVGPHPMLTRARCSRAPAPRAPAPAAGWIPVPQVVPGVVEKLFQPLTFENLLLGGQATGNSVRYAIEGTATSRRRGCRGGRAEARVARSGSPRWTSRSRRSRRAHDHRRAARGRAGGPDVHQLAAVACSSRSRRSGSCSAARPAATRCRASSPRVASRSTPAAPRPATRPFSCSRR